MNDVQRLKAHWSFWLIGGLALLWNVGGSANFMMQLNPEMISAYRASEQAIIIGRPVWATAGFGIGVFGGVIACLLLLLRKSAAFAVFVLSFVGVAVTMVHTLGVDFEFSAAELVMFVAMPLIVAAFLAWYARYSAGRNWIC